MRDLFWVCPNKQKDHWILYSDYLAVCTASTLDDLMDRYRSLILRYRNDMRFLDRVSSMSEVPVVSPSERERLDTLYEEYYFLQEVISDTYDDVRDELKELVRKDNLLVKVRDRLNKSPIKFNAIQDRTQDEIQDRSQVPMKIKSVSHLVFAKA